MITNDATPADIAVLSADLTHVASGIRLEFHCGRVVVAGHVSVDSLQNATELLTESV